MQIKGTDRISTKKFSFLARFGLTDAEALQLKHQKEITTDYNKAKALIERGLAIVVDSVVSPSKKPVVDEDDAEPMLSESIEDQLNNEEINP